MEQSESGVVKGVVERIGVSPIASEGPEYILLMRGEPSRVFSLRASSRDLPDLVLTQPGDMVSFNAVAYDRAAGGSFRNLTVARMTQIRST